MNKVEIPESLKEPLIGMSFNQFKNSNKIFIYNGHSIFQLCIETGEVSKAVTKNNNKFRVEYTPGYIYITALKLDGAIKKTRKLVNTVANMVERGKIKLSSSLKGDSELTATNNNNTINHANTIHN